MRNFTIEDFRAEDGRRRRKRQAKQFPHHLQLLISEEQFRALRTANENRKIPTAQLVREAIDLWIEQGS